MGAGEAVTALAEPVGARPRAVRLEDLGELVAISRPGGQGRVYRPQFAPASLGSRPVVVKLYRRTPPDGSAGVLAEMVLWGRSLPKEQQASLQSIAAWPLAVIHAGATPAGILMRDVTSRFAVPFVMPSGRRERVLLTLEHMLGADGYLELRGLGVRLDTVRRAEMAERISGALAYLHRNGIAAGDIAPNNLLVALGQAGGAATCFIDCDSMAFRGRTALPSVQTGDWEIPAAFAESAGTRAADAYKLGLVVLRLFARSHDARTLAPHLRDIPVELRDLLHRALAASAAARPTAGEWQRALIGLLADGRLGRRHPGPASAPRARAAAPRVIEPAPRARAPAPRVRAPAPRVRAPAVASVTPMPARPPVARAAPRSAAAGAAPWLRRLVVVLWIVAGTMVLAVVLSRLFAAAIPLPANDGVTRTPYQYQYYGYPGDRGSPGSIQVP